jgi:hypothetical protein
MQLSIFLAQLYAVAFMAVGLGFFIAPKYYVKAYAEIMKDSSLFLVWGIFALLAGFLIVTRHNVWQGWPILVTIFGWIALIKGFSLIVLPQYFPIGFKGWFKSAALMRLWGFLTIALGLILGYLSLNA